MSDSQNGFIKKIRRFSLTELALKNRISIFILSVIILGAGLQSYSGIPKESFPEVVIPTIYVGTPYPGNSPIDIENLVTRPIEKELQSVSDVDKITSNSVQDFSSIVVEFKTDVEVDRAIRDVKDAVDKSKSELPTDLDQDPNVFEVNFSEFPIMTINVAGDYEYNKLRSYAEFLEDEIESLSEINKVDLVGLKEQEVRIDADMNKMALNQVSFRDIQSAVADENLSISAGDLKSGRYQRSIRILGEFTSAAQIEEIVVRRDGDKTVHLRDIAEVTNGYEERESYARADQLPVIALNVVKRSGENLLKASDEIKVILEEARGNQLPDDIQISIINDKSTQTRNQVNNLENSIISGVILVTLVLLFFMGLRNALFVGIAIPLSMLISFVIINALGYTLNIMILFGLILALGMLVDNGIVVVENIYRLKEEGYSSYEAASQGVGEVAQAIISSTATTLAAFVPLALWPGLVGNFMKYLPITLIVVLTSSLFVALVMNPVFTNQFMKSSHEISLPSRKKTIRNAVLAILPGAILYVVGLKFLGGLLILAGLLILLNNLLLEPSSTWFQNKLIPFLERIYEATLRHAFRGINVYLYFGGTVVLLIGSIMLLAVSQPQVIFFPDNEPQYSNVFVEMPAGADINYTDSIARAVEARVFEVIQPYQTAVEAVTANVGIAANDPAEGPQQSNTPNKARITISYVEYEKRQGISSSMVQEKITAAMDQFPGAKISVAKNQAGPPVGKPISLEVSGENLDQLINVTDSLRYDIQNSGIRGIQELKSDMTTNKPQLTVQVNRERARSFGLSTAQVANQLRTALFGQEVSKFKDGEDDYPIMLRLKKASRENLSDLLNKRITFRDQQAGGRIVQVPISAVADINYSTTYGVVKRKDLDRVITLSSTVEEGYNANEINQKLKKMLADYPFPEGIEYKFGGEQEKQQENQEFLTNALLIAVFTIFLILVSQFNSISRPFIIIASVIFSTIGVFLGLAITGQEFVIIMTGIGIISLAGIVVNNAIVLIDYTDLLQTRRKQEMGLSENQYLSKEDFVEMVILGGKTRLRPVLLTAITTVLGLVPLAVGLNINFYTMITELDPNIYWGGDNAIFWGPMAWTVIYGLTFATFLTLVIVPVMYSLNEQFNRWIARLRTDKVEAQAS